MFVPIHKDGYKFVIGFAVITLVLISISHLLGWLGILATIWCAYFFRDPERFPPDRQNVVVAPADGRVSAIERVAAPKELDLDGAECVRVSIFLSVFDVHINRMPVAGKIRKLTYVPGKFLNADLDKASEENERQCLTLETAQGIRIGCVQIAGLVARRIVTFVSESDTLGLGERFGLIRFGSRTDVYLPPGSEALVRVGQTAVGGETVLAELRDRNG
ncbi:MAG: phosphatidylserine decarboxylase [Hyphomicrobiaceae bacterium]|nr:phosphatidylserine decarboxylase [Hyphomicrobiaceae bacterium]